MEPIKGKKMSMNWSIVRILTFIIITSIVFLAGCVEEEKSSSIEFNIHNIVLCSEKPRSYMDYKEQPNATYKSGDRIWIYKNLEGTTYNSNPNGTYEVWITEHLTLESPTGEVLLSKEVINKPMNLPKDGDINDIFLTALITTRSQYDEGKYIIKMVVTDKLSNKTVAASTSFTLIQVKNSIAQEPMITNIVFCSESPKGYMEYKEQTNATYQPGDTVYLYMNFENVKYYPNPDGTNEIWITEKLTLKAPNGDILLSKQVLNEHQNFQEELDPNNLFFNNKITTTPQFTKGKYIVEIVATDKLSNNKVTLSANFTINSV